MPRRKLPITKPTPRRSHHHKATQSTIATFHTLNKRRSQLLRRINKVSEADSLKAQLDDVEREISALGGLESYQSASIHGQSVQRGGDSAKVLIEWLRELQYDKRAVRQLEIGALTHDNYASCSRWLDNHPIDLHSQHVDILEQDFFQRPLPNEDADRFDVVSCSLVLNFVPDVVDRGRMLQLIHQHLRPNSHSLLYLVLPLPCVVNSRYLTTDSMTEMMRAIGFELKRKRWKEHGRVGYWLYSWAPPKDESNEWKRKRVIQDGGGRNNFAIVLS